jgi:hypothetical protein
MADLIPTPGPWRYDYEPGYCGELIAANGTSVCTFNDEPDSADAAVMAAAPVTLDAARVLAEFAKTAPGRLPQRVQDAIAAVTASAAPSQDSLRRAGDEGAKPALALCFEVLQALRPDFFRAVHGNQGGCDFDIEVCEQCGAAGDPPDHKEGCFAEKLDAAIRAADDELSAPTPKDQQ